MALSTADAEYMALASATQEAVWLQQLLSDLKSKPTGDPCIYVKEEGVEIFIIAVYVEDILLAGKSGQKINEVKQALAELFQMKDMGQLHYFLGVNVIQKSVLERFGRESLKPACTPVNPGTKLKKAEDIAVSDVARFSADPTEEHWIPVKRIMRYLNGTRDMGLLYDGSKITTSSVGYSDADWAGEA